MILIVDDIPENVYSLQKVLEKHKFTVDTAFSGEEALKKILSKTYVLVILDVQMPGIDGFEVAENIKGFKKAKDTAVIFLSANSIDTSLIIKGYNQGATDYITKPVDPAILLLKVKRVYEIYESRQASTKQTQEINTLYTQEKEQKTLLLNKIKRLEHFLSLAKMGLWEYYPESKTLLCSPEIYKLLNIDPDSQQLDLDFVLNRADFNGLDISDLSKGKKHFQLEHTFTLPDNQIKHLKEFVEIVYSKEGPAKVQGVVQVIEAEKKEMSPSSH
jgi:DNA-binding response OmpR family regulator